MSDSIHYITWTTDEDGDIILQKVASICALFSIVIFCAIVVHCIYYLSTSSTSLNKHSKFLLYVEITMNLLFLMFGITNAFFHTNYITSLSSQTFMANGGILCKATQMSFFALINGKFLVYFMFSFRIYIAFKGTMFFVSLKLYKCLLIIYATAALIFQAAFFTVRVLGVGEQHVLFIRVNDSELVICSLVLKEVGKTIIVSAAAAYTLIDAMFAAYLSYLFISRLRILQTLTMLRNLPSIEVKIQISNSSGSSGSSTARSEGRVCNIENNDGTDDTIQISSVDTSNEFNNRIFRLLFKKHCILSATAISFSIVFWLCAMIIKGPAFGMLVCDLMINSLCIHLMHKMCTPLWNVICTCAAVK